MKTREISEREGFISKTFNMIVVKIPLAKLVIEVSTSSFSNTHLKRKASAVDIISSEFIQNYGDKGIQRITNSYEYDKQLRDNTRRFCSKYLHLNTENYKNQYRWSDFRTMSLTRHASKMWLHLIKRRITPIIGKHLEEAWMGFREGRDKRRNRLRVCEHFHKEWIRCECEDVLCAS